MKTALLNTEPAPLVCPDSSSKRALHAGAGSDKLLVAIWLILCLLTLSCAILVSYVSGSVPVVGISATDANRSIPGSEK